MLRRRQGIVSIAALKDIMRATADERKRRQDIDNENNEPENVQDEEMRSPRDETGIETESSAGQGSDSLMEGHSPRGIQGSSLSSREKSKLINTFPTQD